MLEINAANAVLPNAPPEASFLSGGRPTIIGHQLSGADCQAVSAVKFDNGTPDNTSDDTSVIGNATPNSCLPVEFPPGGFLVASNLPAGAGVITTGRFLIRFPSQHNEVGSDLQPQKGYIVDECSGRFNGDEYNYSPCFVGNLTLTINAPDGQTNVGNFGVFNIPQQDFNVNVFGPVAFEQNGRLVISTVNANEIRIATTAQPFPGLTLPLPATIAPGNQNLQLVGPAIHGGYLNNQ